MLPKILNRLFCKLLTTKTHKNYFHSGVNSITKNDWNFEILLGEMFIVQYKLVNTMKIEYVMFVLNQLR